MTNFPTDAVPPFTFPPDAADNADLTISAPPGESLTVSISLPLASAELVAKLQKTHYAVQKRHIDLRVDKETGAILSRLLLGLDTIGATLRNGRRVVNINQTIRWVLEEAERNLPTNGDGEDG